jgi:hypothetical protein
MHTISFPVRGDTLSDICNAMRRAAYVYGPTNNIRSIFVVNGALNIVIEV